LHNKRYIAETTSARHLSMAPVHGACPWRIPNVSQNQKLAALENMPRCASRRPSRSRDRHYLTPGQARGLRAVVAESVLVKHQLLILNRGRIRVPNLRVSDRIIAGLCALFMRRARILRSAIALKPSTLLNLHAVLTQRKYQRLFSPRCGHRPGPKGPSQELIDAVVAINRVIPKLFPMAVLKDAARQNAFPPQKS
jgi:hypothetical protein